MISASIVKDDGEMFGVDDTLADLAARQAAPSPEDLRAELHLVPDLP